MERFFFTKLDAKEGQKTYRRRLYVLWYLHAELYGCGFKNVRPRVMYMTCKEEQIRLTGAPSYGCVLVISNIVRHNYKLNHNALKHTKLIDILLV